MRTESEYYGGRSPDERDEAKVPAYKPTGPKPGRAIPIANRLPGWNQKGGYKVASVGPDGTWNYVRAGAASKLQDRSRHTAGQMGAGAMTNPMMLPTNAIYNGPIPGMYVPASNAVEDEVLAFGPSKTEMGYVGPVFGPSKEELGYPGYESGTAPVASEPVVPTLESAGAVADINNPNNGMGSGNPDYNAADGWGVNTKDPDWNPGLPYKEGGYALEEVLNTSRAADTGQFYRTGFNYAENTGGNLGEVTYTPNGDPMPQIAGYYTWNGRYYPINLKKVAAWNGYNQRRYRRGGGGGGVSPINNGNNRFFQEELNWAW